MTRFTMNKNGGMKITEGTITVEQTQRASKVARHHGFYLVKMDGITIGSFEKMFHSNSYKTTLIIKEFGICNKTFQQHSTKQQAIDYIVARN